MKLVRGAYMEKERERAEQNNYPDPICATKGETDKNFDVVLKYMFENIEDMARIMEKYLDTPLNPNNVEEKTKEMSWTNYAKAILHS